MIALSLALLPWYPSGMSYFVFGCVMLHLQRVRSILAHAGVLLVLNAAFVGWALWIGYPRQAVLWLPLVTLIVGIIVRVERIWITLPAGWSGHCAPAAASICNRRRWLLGAAIVRNMLTRLRLQ